MHDSKTHDFDYGPIGSPEPSTIVHLGHARMWEGADDADFNAWVRFVTKNTPHHMQIVAGTPLADEKDVIYSAHKFERDAMYKELDEMFISCWGANV